MKHKLFSLFAALCCTICINAQATSGTCGFNLQWSYDTSTKALTITGSGAMSNFSSHSSVPWSSYASSILTVSLPDGLTLIGNYAFYWCTNITTINIPNGVTGIGKQAFHGCRSLSSISIPNSVTSLDIGAFSYCSSATSLTIGNSVTSIGGGAFRGCTGLTSVTIPNSVTSIGDNAFNGCTGLTSITIGNSVTNIGKSAFYDCTSLPIVNNIRYADTYMVEAVDKTLTTYVIRQGTKWIGNEAFVDCSSLKSVTIPNSVINIGESAFEECSNLTSVIIGNNVKSISEQAFMYCYGLTSVTIGNSVTSIGEYAFAFCRGLKSLTIPNGVVRIGAQSFRACQGLTSVTVQAETPPTLGDYAFHSISKTIPIYVPAGSVSAYQNWGDFTNILPISAESASVTTNTTSDITENSVDISWPQVAGADQYVIEIRFNNVRVCTVTFNDQGQLLSIAFAAPSRLRDRENNAAQALANGWKYAVFGLDADKTYTYSVIAKNSGGTTIDTKTGTFKTLPLSGLEEILSAPNATDSKKILIDGQIYILRDGKAYDLTGKEVL